MADTADTVDMDTADTAEIWTWVIRHGTEPLHLKHGFFNTISDENMEPKYPTRGQYVIIMLVRLVLLLWRPQAPVPHRISTQYLNIYNCHVFSVYDRSRCFFPSEYHKGEEDK